MRIEEVYLIANVLKQGDQKNSISSLIIIVQVSGPVIDSVNASVKVIRYFGDFKTGQVRIFLEVLGLSH